MTYSQRIEPPWKALIQNRIDGVSARNGAAYMGNIGKTGGKDFNESALAEPNHCE